MKLHIKNMVCNRCKMVVKAELEKLGFKPLLVELGEVTLAENISPEDKIKISDHLTHFGFELLEDKKTQIAEQIKTTIISLVHYTQEPLKINLSTYLSEQLKLEYTSLSSIFGGGKPNHREVFHCSKNRKSKRDAYLRRTHA